MGVWDSTGKSKTTNRKIKTMKATELRIGNYVFDNLGGILKIKGVNTESDLSHIKPIPLTEEWMIDFGMDYTDGFSNSRKLCLNKHEFDCSVLTYSEKEGLLRFSNGEQNGTSLIPHVKYVHQLQNLYFALTGQELTLNEKEQ
jgi:hypothetical protein